MPTIRFRQSIAAGDTVENALAGSQFEFLPFNANLEFGINADANGHEVLADVYSGQDVLLENAPCNAQARMPVYPDDFDLTDVAAAGERIKVRLKNTGAGAHVANVAVRITPI